ncbi:C-GCAxxG-C-C family protein [Desulfovibrio sp. UCD-KL4C]|uniref:C-GCAxxG-C-C family protein n=1 Tax=Desulfovibrio sp. UCD-KL4C TaxID=2578120 RepID=UPI0025C65F6B|nr:C-GCAxxG-C-C family protein [Desulfovibrio sp. UCD-KL4C]
MNGQKARYYFENGYMCAESVLLAICEAQKIENSSIPAIATAFCSGTARTKGNCGALAGGILAISLIHGRTEPDQSVDLCYKLTQQLTAHFKNKFNSDNCFKIIDCDLSITEGRDKFKNNDIKQKVCLDLVEEVTDYTLNILTSEQKN